MDLFEDNSNVLLVLPSLLEGLYTWGSPTDIAANYINNEITKLSNKNGAIYKRLKEISRQLEMVRSGQAGATNTPISSTWSLDSNKVITLSLIFGNIFTDALEILSNSDNIKFYKPQGLTKSLINTYMATGTGGIIVGIHDPSKHKKHGVSPAVIDHINEQIIEIEINQLLHKLGLLYINNQLIHINNPNPDHQCQQDSNQKSQLFQKLNQCFDVQVNNYMVDLFNWYCSCDQYQSCYTDDWINHTYPDYGPITSSSSTNELFAHIKLDRINPLPLCCHLMVLLIVRANQSDTNWLVSITTSLDDLI